MANILELLTKGQNALIGQPNSYGGMVDEESQKQAQAQARMMLAASLLEAGGPSSQPTNFGQALGRGMMAGQQAQQSSLDSSLKAMMLKQQMAKAQQQQDNPYGAISPDKFTPESLREFAKTKDYGVLVPRDSAGQRPSAIQEFEYFSGLSPEQQKTWMSVQRQPTAPQLAVINGVPTLVDRIQGTQTPLTSQQAEQEAAAGRKRAEAEGAAIGAASGEAKGTIEKKALAASNVNDLLDMAEPIIASATGSSAGALADKGAAAVGISTKGDQATAQLKILQSALMFAQPRMEGPQGVLDVKLYEQAAGELGDPTVPRERKLAAIKTIRELQAKYSEGAAKPNANSGAPAVGQTTTINGVKVTRKK